MQSINNHRGSAIAIAFSFVLSATSSAHHVNESVLPYLTPPPPPVSHEPPPRDLRPEEDNGDRLRDANFSNEPPPSWWSPASQPFATRLLTRWILGW